MNFKQELCFESIEFLKTEKSLLFLMEMIFILGKMIIISKMNNLLTKCLERTFIYLILKLMKVFWKIKKNLKNI
jgi:hypothetical protein